MSDLHQTRIDIPEDAREKLVDLLNRQLADTMDLFSQVKYAHWNVKGSDFIQLHELFDDIAGHVLAFNDLIAERATTLGGTANGTVRQSAAASTLSEYPTSAVEGMDAVQAVAERVAQYAAGTRRAMEASEDLGDMSTNDLFTEVSRQIDKDLWFLEAHLQSKA
ncbi:MAG: DNA starvation/stationary phase protection protein Dps [Acidimicrobiia bacterium]